MGTNDLFNDEAERTLLGIELVDNSKIPLINCKVLPDEFFTVSHKTIQNAILDLYRRGKPVDIVSVSEYLRFNGELEQCGGREYISLLAEETITVSNYDYYCKVIAKYNKKRRLLTLTEEIQKQLETSGNDVEDIASKSKLELEDIMLNRSTDCLTELYKGLEGTVDQIEHIVNSDGNILGYATGFHELDKALSGLCPGRLYILGARPAMGKSAMAFQISENIAKTKRVVFASLEMSTTDYVQRMVFSKTGLSQERLSRGMYNPETIYDEVYSTAEDIANLKLYIIDDSNCTLNKIESGIVSCIAKYGSCDMVVVDYLQLMASDNPKEHDSYKIVSANSQGLKKLARKYDIPILALCQLSRGLEVRQDKRPILSDLRDSGAIEQDADCVLFIYREEIYDPSPMNKGKAELIVAKNRQGRICTVPMVFEAMRTRFREVPIDR